MPVDTRSAPRRDLTFASFDDLIRELDRLDAADKDGRLKATGNWTPGQIAEHCAKFLRFALDGFPARGSAIVRVIARALLLRKATGPEPMPPGISLPRSASALLPSPGVSAGTGLRELRAAAERVRSGARMTHPSPLLGRLTHEQWSVIQLKHCALHLSFIAIG